jgi:hypothetical protein
VPLSGSKTYCENTAQVILFVDNENTITSLGSHKLSRFYDQDVLLHSQGLSWSKGRHGASNFFGLANSGAASPFLGEFLLDFLSDGLTH